MNRIRKSKTIKCLCKLHLKENAVRSLSTLTVKAPSPFIVFSQDTGIT